MLQDKLKKKCCPYYRTLKQFLSGRELYATLKLLKTTEN